MIPGLPDDLGRECLTRIPYDHFDTVRSVCRLWRHEIHSPDFHRTRKQSGLAQTVIAFVQAEPTHHDSPQKHRVLAPAYHLTLYEPEISTWRTLPPPPELSNGLPLFCQLAGVGHELVVVGGWDPQTWAASDRVFVYDFLTATWREGARMPGPKRSFFACASSDARRTVIVAGGHDERKDAMRSAMAYDVARDEWVPMPNMAVARDECRGVFIRGKFHVIGGYATETQGCFETSAECFDPATWSWSPAVKDKIEAGTCPGTCVVGGDSRLYMCVAGRLMVLDNDTWRTAAELPVDVRTALSLVAWRRKVLVMGAGSHGGAQVAYELDFVRAGDGLTWRKVELPEEYSGHVQATSNLLL